MFALALWTELYLPRGEWRFFVFVYTQLYWQGSKLQARVFEQLGMSFEFGML